MLQDKGRNSIGGVPEHSFAIDVKWGEKKNIAINDKGGDSCSRLSLMSIWKYSRILNDDMKPRRSRADP